MELESYVQYAGLSLLWVWVAEERAKHVILELLSQKTF